MNVQPIAATAVEMTDTPFIVGRNCVVANLTAAAVQLTGSDDGVTYTNLVNPGAGAIAAIDKLPAYVKGTSSTVYLLGGV